MGDMNVTSSAPTTPVQAPVPTPPPAQSTPTPVTAPAPQAPADKASVAQQGSSAASVSLVETAPAVEGPANGPFEYNDRAVTMFNQFAASGKVHSGRIPVLDHASAEMFSKDLLAKIAVAKGASPAEVEAMLSSADPVRTLQQVVGARTDGRFGPETLYKTVQLVQSQIQAATTPETLASAKTVISAFGGKVRGLDDMLAAQTLRVGQSLISSATSVDALDQVEKQLQPVLQDNPTLKSMVDTKRSALVAEADRAAAAAKAQQEAEAAAKAKAEAEAANKAKEEADKQAAATHIKDRQDAVDAAMTPVKDTNKDDDVARHLVSKGYNKDATTSQKVTLINSMLDGFTGDDDEKAIIAILKDDIAAGKINETLSALGKKRVGQLFDDIDGKENDQLLTTLYTANNISKDHLNTFTAHMVAEGYESKLVDLGKGKRGTLSDTAAPIVLNHLLKTSPSGKDEAVRGLKTRIGMEGLISGKVDMSRLYGYMGKDKDKAAFVVDILKTADGFQDKINKFARPATPDPAVQAKYDADYKALCDGRDYALAQAKAAIANADDDQTVEFMKQMIGPSDKPHSLKSFASLPEPLLNQLHKNLDSFWNNTWKTSEEKQYRQIIEDALAVKRRAAFGNDGDASAVPGSGATNPTAPTAAPTTAPADTATPPAGTPAPEAPKAVEPTPVTAAPPSAPAAPPADPVAPGAAAAAAAPKSPNND